MPWGILIDLGFGERDHIIGSHRWVLNDYTKEPKRFPSKASAEWYGKLSFGPFPAAKGAVKPESFRGWKVQQIKET